VRKTVQAVLATLGVIDLDGDIITRGAFDSGQELLLSDFGHSTILASAPPVGKGVVSVVGDELLLEGEFFDTSRGEEAFATVAALGALAEWSPTFKILDSERPVAAMRERGARLVITKARAREASPVWMGAGVGTRTLATALKLGRDDAMVKLLQEDLEQAEIRVIAARHRARGIRHDRIRNRR
jgi:hypothetical protein